MSYEFYVGQKVVCVDDAPSGVLGTWDGQLKLRCIYSVRWVGMYDHIFEGKSPCVRLVGIVRNNPSDGADTPFHARRFRPLIERSDAIEIFRAIARDPGKTIPEGQEPKRKEQV